MKRKTLLAIFTLVFGLTLTSYVSKNNEKKHSIEEFTYNASKISLHSYDENIKIINNDTLLDNKKSNIVATQAEEASITIQDIALFLNKKNEHYPLSDEFIEKYQQTSGGYIDFAKKTGHLIDRQKHEPNQKWHFFDSWLLQSIEDGTLTWDADAKKRVYNGLLCPELLLWIFEATEVSPSKVKAAKEVAEKGKVAGTNVSTIAKNMRACVPWDDIQNTILNAKA